MILITCCNGISHWGNIVMLSCIKFAVILLDLYSYLYYKKNYMNSKGVGTGTEYGRIDLQVVQVELQKICIISLHINVNMHVKILIFVLLFALQALVLRIVRR